MGPTSYGLTGFYATLSLFLAFLDQAISPTLARELARSAHQHETAKDLRSLLRTLEVLSGAIAVILGAVIAAGAPLIARHWLINSGVPESELIEAIRLMGLCLACQWPSSLYGSGYVGLQRQDLLVPVRVVFTTAQSVGAVVLLGQVTASPLLFFAWMAITSAAMSFTLRQMLWRMIPAGEGRTRIDLKVLRTVWRFATGNLVIGLTTALLTQSGGLIIAKYCTLDQLAAYTLALNLASQVSTMLVQPVSITLMPHFARLSTQHNEVQLAKEYHRWSQISAALALPISGTLIVFGRPLLQLWLGKSSPLVDPVLEILPWIAVGALLNVLMTQPYLLQIAHGWTRLSVVANGLALVTILPALVFGVPRYGPLAAAVCWVGVNVGYVLLMVPYMHRRLLRQEMWRWWGQDTLLPVITVGLVYAAAAAIIPAGIPRIGMLAIAGAVAVLAWGALFFVLPSIQSDAIGLLKLIWSRVISRR